MFNEKEKTDEEIREELLKSFELSDESLEKVAGGASEDTREDYPMNQEDINKSIFRGLY